MKNIVRQTVLIILFITPCRLDAQNTPLPDNKENFQIKLFYKTGCDSTTGIMNNYALTLNSQTYTSDSGICYLPERGKYTLNSYGIESLETHSILITSNYQVDTIIFSKISVSRSSGIPPWPYISICGVRAEGNHSDFWPNGKPRIVGKFRKGDAKKISFYNSSGNLVKRQVNKKLHTLYELYEEDKLILRYRRVLIFSYGEVWDKDEGKYVTPFTKIFR